MKSHFISFIFLALIGCSSSPLILTPTQYTYSGKERTRQLDKENPQLEPTIALREIQHSIWGRTAIIEIQGWYSSQGLQARVLKKIDWIKETEGDQLTLTFYIQPKAGMGKESADVYGYNYKQKLKVTIPTTIQQLNFKLIEQKENQQDILSYQSHEFLPHSQ